MNQLPVKIRVSAALLVAVPVGTLLASADARAAPLAINGDSFSVSDLENDGPLIDLDGDGINDFQLGFLAGGGEFGAQLFLSAPLLPNEGAPRNSILGEFEGFRVLGSNNGPAAAPFDSAGLSLSGLESGETTTAAEVLANTYDSAGRPTDDFQGNFTAVDQAVLYNSQSFFELLIPGNAFNIVFDIPGGSPFVATIDLDGAFDAAGNLSGFTVASGSGFETLASSVPEPASAGVVALGCVALAGRRRRD